MHVSMGTRFYISPQLPTNIENQELYERLPFVQIRGVRHGGEITEQHAVVERSPLNLSHSYQDSAGEILPSIPWEVIKLPTDRGQQLLYDAFRLGPQAFHIWYPEGKERFFVAKVRARTDIIIDQSTMRGYRYELDLQSRVVDKP